MKARVSIPGCYQYLLAVEIPGEDEIVAVESMR
jgi:hypothetical protein